MNGFCARKYYGLYEWLKNGITFNKQELWFQLFFFPFLDFYYRIGTQGIQKSLMDSKTNSHALRIASRAIHVWVISHAISSDLDEHNGVHTHFF